MHKFDYEDTPSKLLTPDIINLLTAIHECKGRQELFIEAEPDVLATLLDIAKIQSTKASNQIEGIYTSDKRLKALVLEKASPRNRSEEEIAGYREALAIVHESYKYITICPNNILQLHKNLYGFSGNDIGGRYKNADNIIAEYGNNGIQKVRFMPVPAFQTSEAIEYLCLKYSRAIDEKKYDPLLLTPIFILDFLCIHPFNDGNGRMSRLLTLLTLYRSGYIVGKYISIEMLIEKSKSTYYEALHNSSIGWHDNSSDYISFLRYYLGIILRAYKEFQNRVEHIQYGKLSKQDRVKAMFDKKMGKIKKSDIAASCPDISESTIERALKELLNSGYIEKVGNARATGYIKKNN